MMLPIEYQYINAPKGKRKHIFRINLFPRPHVTLRFIPHFATITYSNTQRIKEVKLDEKLEKWLNSHTPSWGMASFSKTKRIDLYFGDEAQAMFFKLKWL